MKTRFTLWLLTVVAIPSTAICTPITFYFHGTVQTVGGEVDNGTVSVGESVEGSFTFESTTPDFLDGDSGFGRYLNAVSDASFSFGAYSGFLAAGEFAHIDVLDNANPFPRDAYNVSPWSLNNSVVGAPINGNELDSFRFQLNDPTGSAFSDDSLPLAPPLIADFTTDVSTSYLLLQFRDGTTSGQTRQIRADFSYLSTSPLPSPVADGGSTLLMCIVGMLSLMKLKNSRKHP